MPEPRAAHPFCAIPYACRIIFALSGIGLPEMLAADAGQHGKFDLGKPGHCIAACVFGDAYREMPGNDYNIETDFLQHDWAGLLQTLQARASAAFRKQNGQ